MKTEKAARDSIAQNLNVDEACGVDPTQMRTNQLMGENSQLKASEGIEAKALRKQKQAFGAQCYAAYIWLFGFLMTLAFFDYLPVFDFERSLTAERMLQSSEALRSTLYIPMILSVLYLVSIFGIQKYMENKEPFGLRIPLASWSLFLGLFSLIGSLRTVPSLFNMIFSQGIDHVVCGDTRSAIIEQPAGFWTGIFILSKVPELVDTFFIVLRKRKLIALHWYHHITVMLFCWHSWGTFCLYGLIFAAMNLTVHAFMYIFYYFAALGYRPTAFAQSITLLQISQMLVGTAITLYATTHMTLIVPQDIFGSIMSANSLKPNIDVSSEVDEDAKCFVNPGNAIAGIGMYASYLWLFCVFFYYAYLKPAKKTATAAKKTN